MFGNHERQLPIIRLLPALICLLMSPAAARAACVSCLVLHIPAQAADELGDARRNLDGLVIVVDAAEVETATLDRLRGAGALPGVVLPLGAPVPAGDVLARADVLVVTNAGMSAGTDALSEAQAIFALQTASTAARAARPGIRILVDAGGVPPAVAPYVTGRVRQGGRVSGATAETLAAASLAGGADPALLRLDDVDWTAVAAFAAMRGFGSGVTAPAVLTVEEIVARHQAHRERQEQIVLRTIARGTSSLLFEVPGFVAPVAVTAGTVIYRAPGLTEIEQRDVRVNGAAIAGGGASSPPRLPLIEPERISTPPLAIALDAAYRYELVGEQVIDGETAYVVAFDGAEARGRAWIDQASFALRRLEVAQSGLRGAIVSSEQHDRFAPFHTAGHTVWLPIETRVYQTYEGAGHRTPIHRTIRTPEYDINPDDFDGRLREAHASPHLMLRDTPQGFRYLLREAGARDGTAREVAPRAGERMRTAVAGVLVDPNISTPLPFAGFSYVDLNLFDTGAQLNAFFGGSYGHVSWSVPSVAGTRWQAHGTAFAIAIGYNDRAFRGGVEQYAENITQRPARLTAGVSRTILGRLRARFDYELDYTAFDRADTTAPSFAVPVDAIVHAARLSMDADSGPWTARAWWNPAARQRWRPWGFSGGDAPDARAFQRFGAAVARTLALSPRVSSRVEAAWMGGTDLDRFSRYTFDAFENRLQGYPTASIRYTTGGVARTVTSWAARGWRADIFGDIALVRDPGFGDRLRGYPGAGAAVELSGPFRTLWAVEWGYGFRAHSQALRMTAYRTF